jgi:O-antigen biosynthesis protein
MDNLNPLDHPVIFCNPLRLTPHSAWIEHIPFAMLIVELIKPKVFVELGTEYGDSYCAFCQAVKELKLKTVCYAIDTWQGDPQTGFYGPEVLFDLKAHHDPLYHAFSNLIQTTFDDALCRFKDGSIDLLHIDGYHIFEAVKHDFESWLAKMSPSGIILLHDINTRERDFGTVDFFSRVKKQYPYFEFFHGSGLGMLAVNRIPEAVAPFFSADETKNRLIRDFFSHQGHQLAASLESSIRLENTSGVSQKWEARTKQLENQSAEGQEYVNHLNREIHNRDTQIKELKHSLADIRNDNLEIRNELNRIKTTYSSKLARVISYPVDKLAPLFTLRRLIFNLTVKVMTHPVTFFGLLNKKNIREFWRYFSKNETVLLEQLINDKWYQSQLTKKRRATRLKKYREVPYENKVKGIRIFRSLDFSQIEEPQVSIIIPVYNQWQFTYNCLLSIHKNTRGVAYEIIIVDDCSSDQTRARLKSVKGIQVIHNETNQGFVSNCNKGAKLARARYLLFLNNDTYVISNWLAPLVDVIHQDQTAAVGSKLIFPDGSLQEAGSITWQDGSALGYGRNDDSEKPEYNFLREVDYCSGASLLVNREFLSGNSVFDERYSPGYYEDNDLCMSLREKGYKVKYQPLSTVVHYEGKTGGTDPSSGAKRFQEINKPLFVEKWKTTLKEKHYLPVSSNILTASNRSSGKRLLMIDDRIPVPAQGSGYPRAYSILKFLAELGYKVTFFPYDNKTAWEPETQQLQQLGIELLYNQVNFESFARNRAGFYELILVSRPHNLESTLKTIRRYWPAATLIYDAEALFSLREVLKAEVQGTLLNPAQITAMLEDEIDLIKMADWVITVSENERKIIQQKTSRHNVSVFGHAMEIHEPEKAFSDRKDILFVGGFLSADSPNEDAITYFAGEIFPRVKNQTNCKLFIVGANPPESVKKLNSNSVIVTGFVPDLKYYYERCRVFVVPHRFSAGIPWKLQEAMSFGIPAVVSSLTASQLDLKDRQEVMVASNPNEYVQKIIGLYYEKELWSKIQTQALAYIRDQCASLTLMQDLALILKQSVSTKTIGPVLTTQPGDAVFQYIQNLELVNSPLGEYIKVHSKRYWETFNLARTVLNQESRVLDAGSFPPVIPALIAKYTGCKVTCSGLNAQRVVITNPQQNDVFETEIVSCNLEKDRWPFNDREFDLVICTEVLEHLGHDPMYMVSEINRVLKLEGYLILTTPNIACSRSLNALLESWNPYLMSEFVIGSNDRHNREYTAFEVKLLLESGGFLVEKLETRDVWSGPYPQIEAALQQLGKSTRLRGDDIFILAHKMCAVIERYPEKIYLKA